ncbi:MAG: DMT family transporter [Flavobacteriales bacterium]|jgi:drug/metabolite transporter (DMT)-like permease|nr:DMT family transporter [Flavobacteriales bacterium]
MISIILTILLFSLLVIFFKLFERFNVISLHAISINYLFAAGWGFVFAMQPFNIIDILDSKWIYHAMVIGCMFIFVFNLLALGTQKVGIAVATVANKMSLVIPVIFSLFFYASDTVNFLKIVGISLALAGVYFSSTEGGKLAFDKRYLWLIATIFFMQGVADITFNHAQETTVQPEEMETFFGALFLVAGLAGSIAALPKIISKQEKLKPSALLFGIMFGITNYLTLQFMFEALSTPGLEPSLVYPLVSMGVVLTSAIAGLVFFKEKLSLSNWFGIGLAVVAIATLAYAA